jgi:hypothetical protein
LIPAFAPAVLQRDANAGIGPLGEGNMRAAPKAIGLLLFSVFASCHARAGEKVEIKIGKIGNNPPFTISGWRYQLVNNNIQMHVCASSLCEPGSKMSYIVMPPRKDYSFEQYKDEREKVARALRKVAPAGTRIDFAEPEKSESKIYRIFKTKREEVTPDGKTTAFLSWLVMMDKVTFEFISSASTSKKAEEQLAPFMVACMMVSAINN